MTQTKSFGEMNFGNAQLGDKRRTERLVKLVDQLCVHLGGSLPQKFRSPADLQAFYRLMDKDDVTHEAVLKAHREATFERIQEMDSPVLILHDTTELDYTTHKSLSGLGQIGCGTRRGYLAHNSLAVDPENREVLGLVNQVLHHRQTVSKSETRAQRSKRDTRESLLWLKGVQALPRNRQLIDVCDRGADTTEFIEHEVSGGRRFVIRSSHNRCIVLGHDDKCACEMVKLHEHMKTLPAVGTWSLEVTSRVELRRGRGTEKKKVVTLLQLREAARRPDAKTRKANTVVGKSCVEMLSLWRHKKINQDWTVHEFYYALARLGGHQNRKHDHPPGWQVIWEGWKELLPMTIGYDTAKSKYYKKCG